VHTGRRVRLGVLLLIAIACVGTAWFWLIEHWNLLDSLQQTITTITTVGLGEVHPFDDSAKVFTIFLSVFGVAAGLFTLGAVFEEQLEDTLVRFGRKRMDRRIAKCSNHVVVCGYGRVGSQIARLLRARDAELVIIELDERRVHEAAADDLGAVAGSSTEDDVLLAAGIDRAATLIVSLASDADAMSTVLSARALNPTLRIIARANESSSEAKLLRAGCDRVVNPLSQGAHRMVAFAQQPDVADFLDVVVHDEDVEYQLEEFRIPPGSEIAGVALGDAHVRRRTGALVLALRQADGSFVSIPGPEVTLQADTTVIALGTGDQLAELGRLVEVEVERGSTS
jgi:voltage-gated potassium channel